MDPMRPGGRWRGGFSIVDADGRVILPGSGMEMGRAMMPKDLKNAQEIVVEGSTVGWLIVPREGFPRTLAESAFLHQMNRTFFFSAAIAGGLAVLLGVILARTLTRPLQELTTGTRAIAEGDLSHRVPVRSKDELGQLAQSFNQMGEQLSHSQDLRRQMTADIAHELRTPISVILGHAEAVHDGVLPPSGETFELVRDEANHLDRLVDDLRVLSRADAGELTIEPQLIQLDMQLEQIARAYRPTAASREVEIRVQVEEGTLEIPADPDRMAQVLGNLISNALQHSPEGSVIQLSASRVGGNIQIGVADQGSGIPAEDLTRVFDRFYRTDAARNRYHGGSGLGLAIAKSLVEAQGGEIWAESTAGEGTKIWISFPN
jgi:signal transduction histidine kinase